MLNLFFANHLFDLQNKAPLSISVFNFFLIKLYNLNFPMFFFVHFTKTNLVNHCQILINYQLVLYHPIKQPVFLFLIILNFLFTVPVYFQNLRQFNLYYFPVTIINLNLVVFYHLTILAIITTNVNRKQTEKNML